VALEIVEQTKPDLVIVDAETPSGDGFASIAPLRERAGGRVLPVLLLTGDPYPYRSSEDLGADVTDYLAKPPNLPMLRARVRAWLARASNSTTIRPAGRPATVLSDRAEPTLERITDLIASVPVFGSLTQEQLRLVAANARLESFEAGQRIVHQGDVSDSLYILLSGRVRVSEPTEDPGPGEVVLSELGPGQVFGEMGVLVERARSATVVAVEATRCVALPAFDLVRVLQDAPEVALALLRVLSDRIYETDRRLARYAPDPLTGLPSRRAFHDQYARLVAQARRRGTRVMLLLLDVRNLKVINDHLGYEIGDEVLRTVADALMESARKADLVARYGGDEFVALLVDANEHALQAITERLRAKLAELAPKRGLNIPIECAIGVAMAERPPEAVDDLLIMADQDMQKRRATTASP
jgi:diguanylate cyclase (GGDEF)-like protein